MTDNRIPIECRLGGRRGVLHLKKRWINQE